MPTYWKNRNLIQFAAFKNHIGRYPGAAAVEAFADQLKEYRTSKGTIQIFLFADIPQLLVGRLALLKIHKKKSRKHWGAVLFVW